MSQGEEMRVAIVRYCADKHPDYTLGEMRRIAEFADELMAFIKAKQWDGATSILRKQFFHIES